MNVFHVVLGALNVTFFLVWAFSVRIEWGTGTLMDTTRVDMLQVLLAALEVLVAVLAVGLAALAVVGFNEIRQRSINRAEETAREVADRRAEEIAREVADREIKRFQEQYTQDMEVQRDIQSASDVDIEEVETETVEEVTRPTQS